MVTKKNEDAGLVIEGKWGVGVESEWSYFVGNVLVGVKNIFLLKYPLVWSLFKLEDVGVF